MIKPVLQNELTVRNDNQTRFRNALVGTSVMFMPMVAFAEGEVLTPAQVTSALTGVGAPALIGAALVVMLGIGAAIWGGKKVLGFFGR